MRRVTVEASTQYDIVISRGCLALCGGMLVDVAKTKRFAIITDDTVDALYSAQLVQTLCQQGCTVSKFAFPHGEASKSHETLFHIYDFLAANAITRSDCLIALGGGVVGDITGFAAATWLRGIQYIQIPTTLLAQIDSSVGGKTAIDLPSGKNQVGAFKQPQLVICDPNTLRTLPREILADGMAEAIKYGMIQDAELFELIAAHSIETVPACIDEIIERCICIKRDIVAEDEFDVGQRMLLNFGHTLGHAIETISGFSYTHGQAVAAGMCLMSRQTASPEVTERLRACVRTYHLPDTYDAPMNEITKLCGADKKRRGDTIDFVICEQIGQGVIVTALLSEFRRVMEVS